MVIRVSIENRLVDPKFFARVVRRGAKDAMDIMSERLQAAVVNDTLQQGSPVGFDKTTDRGFLAKGMRPIAAVYRGTTLSGGVESSAAHAAVIEYGGKPWKRWPPYTPIREWVKRRMSIAYADRSQVGMTGGKKKPRRKYATPPTENELAVKRIYVGMAKRLMSVGMKPRYYMRRAWDKYGDMLIGNFNTMMAEFISDAQKRRGDKV